ncbi:MAG: biopolymer transporter ExbD [candidate division KSB1 bacterium]|nr:biopolymer transporter ExbD [candidate division KSB1 bacterium]MDZ7274011.1 biopolymer transporter ExbD [candidate division KSB1 bacterium]MDZ7286384.1 biopolymer transporter ExbD [candidate division KSB1 bacterium]MDZ7296612.1 biopolymer transporter ExbD [candidate division KSB1 bacterium]MDZ7306834.1 biopolymer transporter ExbD [candidate division KSB1 bacterium]
MIRRPARRMPEIPTASLADVAFLILIFFLATTHIDVEKGIRLTLPAKGAATVVARPDLIMLLINAQGEVLLDEQEVALAAIKEVLQPRLAANPNLIVSVKAHPQAEYRVYLAVIDQIKQAGGRRISIAEPD